MNKRATKYDKELKEFKKKPEYGTIKDLYINNNITSIASARKLLNTVKYTKTGNIKKSSLLKTEQLQTKIEQLNYKIKNNQSINDMNITLNIGLKTKKLKRMTTDDFNILLKNLSSQKKYMLKVKTNNDEKFYKINNNSTQTLKLLNNKYDEKKITGLGENSDSWIKSNYYEIKEYEIIEIDPNASQFIEDQQKRRKMNRNVGKFKFYNTHQAVDISDYQIYTKDQVIDNKNCLIYSLEKESISNDLINNVIVKYSETEKSANDIIYKTFEYIKQKDFKNVCNIICRDLNITTFSEKKQKQIKYKSDNKIEDSEPIELAIYNNHIFNNHTTKYKRYAVLNYEKIKHKKDWYLFSEITNKKDGKFLTVLELVHLLDNNKFFEPIPLDIDLTDDIKLFTTNDLLQNIEQDQREFIYKPKEIRPSKYYFADLENINKTEEISRPFLSGIISETDKEPLISTGENCVMEMLDYIVVRSKFGVDNIVYFHNLKYDLSLMKQYINLTYICEKDNNIYMCKIIYKNKHIEFRDSYKVFNKKLSEFSDTFKLSKDIIKQDAINYDYYTEETIKEPFAYITDYKKGVKKEEKLTFLLNVKPFIIKDKDDTRKKFNHMEYYKWYLKYDCLVLKEGMISYNECMKETFGKPIFNFLTISSYADDYFKSKGVYDNMYEVCSGLKKYLSKAVYGGRTNVCKEFKKKVINERINDYDGVSLYPSAIHRLCSELGIPIGKAKRMTNKNDIMNKDYYVVDIHITKINKQQQNPFICVKTEESLFYTNEPTEKGLYLTVDKITLEDYIKFHEIEYEIIDGVYYDEGFNNKFICILDVFNERKKQKALKTTAGETKQELYKLIMNSAYGKTLLKCSSERDYIVDSKDFLNYCFNNFNSIKYCKKLSEHQYIITQYEKDDSYNRSIAGIAVLSMSKRIMNEVMDIASSNNIDIYYQDTDSMHLKDKDINLLEDLYFKTYNRQLQGKQLGQFHSDFNHKNKNCKNVVSIKSIFLEKKAYIDLLEGTLEDGTKDYCLHFRLKGINEIAVLNIAKQYKHDNMNDNIFALYEDLANDKTIKFILNPNDKVSFNFTSNGVCKKESNTFTREVNFIEDKEVKKQTKKDNKM